MEETRLRNWNLQLFADEGDKTEEPTPHRLREARRRGQVFKSIELNSALNMLGMALLFMVAGKAAYGSFMEMMQAYLGDLFIQSAAGLNQSGVTSLAYRHFLGIAGPVFVVALGIGLVSNLAQVGFVFTGAHISPQLNRLNPVEGLKRIFSRRALFELVKAIIKVIIIGATTFFLVRSDLDRLMVLINQPAALGARVFWETMARLGLVVGLVFLGLALMDYLYQRYEHQKSMRMTVREVKEELKHLEGDPLVRSRIRERQRAIARRRMLQEVPTADVVITNPTEIAVALRYRQEENQAPVVVAKGIDYMAARIREIAAEHEIEIVENPPVAQMIWKHCEVGSEIPVELYQAVAEILALIYRNREKKF